MTQRSLQRWAWAAVSISALSACASYDLQQGLKNIDKQTQGFTQQPLQLAMHAQERQERERVAADILAKPLDQPAAVRLMLANSPAFQALLAQHWSNAADAAQSGRIGNPMFSFERLVTGPERELSRFLSFGLLDVLTLPARSSVAEHRVALAQLQFAADVVDQVTAVRQAWVDAVAAQQSLAYARQVYGVAEAGADLARRMEAVGNFNRLSTARHQAVYADAGVSLVLAEQQAQAQREALVRRLGLTDAQAKRLQLPARLPSLPEQPLGTEQLAQRLSQERLDVQQAKAQWQAAARAQGLSDVTSLTDVEMTLIRATTSEAGGDVSRSRGYEVGISLPVFDSGDLKRQGMSARTLAAANVLEATLRAAGSHVRESYVAYRSAYDISRQFRDELLPLQQTIADENLLRYNGMIIGVFELIAGARQQINVVRSAIDAQQQFWRADAALQASLIGRPVGASLRAVSASAGDAAGGGH